jgi:hypothetical protein
MPKKPEILTNFRQAIFDHFRQFLTNFRPRSTNFWLILTDFHPKMLANLAILGHTMYVM